jgi:hypothetical protein
MAEEHSSSSSSPKSSGKKGTRVRTAFPVGSFEGENFPTITSDGTELNQTELKAAQESAAENGVRLIVEDGS